MPFSTLTRDKTRVLNALETVGETVIAREPLQIVFPAWFEEVGLAEIATHVYTLGIYAIIVGDKFATNIVPSQMRLTPTNINKTKYQDYDYYVLNFEKGETVVENINLVKENTMGYHIYHNLIDLGRVPWYMSALNLLQLFENTGEYTGVTYGDNHVATELISSMIMRSSQDVNTYWRQEANTITDVENNPPTFIPLRNVPYGARTTTAKLMGAYFNEGLNSALINPSESVERVEELLRQ